MTPMSCPLVRHERILVPIDGSANSDLALNQAINLAKACGSRLYLLTVVPQSPEYFHGLPALEEKQGEAARELLGRAGRRVEQEQIPCELLVHSGDQPHEFIVQEARDKRVDLIVMGSHGRTGLKRLLMGSVTAKVVGHAPCAVMVIPQSLS
jgi:nucleotide-binding universal stress UspA family protein